VPTLKAPIQGPTGVVWEFRSKKAAPDVEGARRAALVQVRPEQMTHHDRFGTERMAGVPGANSSCVDQARGEHDLRPARRSDPQPVMTSYCRTCLTEDSHSSGF
jgi:hypothetical protein